MSKQPGRKALIVLSDGVDHGSKETLAEAIETAQRADTVVYSILFADHEGASHGFGMGGPNMDPATLLRNPKVKEELKVTD